MSRPQPRTDDVWLYRVYERTGAGHERLLYIGISCDPTTRLRTHRGKAWWPESCVVTLEGPYPRVVAADLERIAIRSEAPPVNRNRAAETLRSRW